MTGEAVMKNDGAHSLEGKCNLNEWTGVEGLKGVGIMSFTRGDTGKCQSWKEGFEYKQNDFHCKVLFDLCKKASIIDAEGTWLVNDDVLVGDKAVVDVNAQKLSSYEAGLVWTPKKDFTVGLKHEFNTTGAKPDFGKMFVMFHHNVEGGKSLATEFVYNHLK